MILFQLQTVQVYNILPLRAKLDLAIILAVLGIFFIQFFPNWTACSPTTYTNTQKTGNSHNKSSPEAPVADKNHCINATEALATNTK